MYEWSDIRTFLAVLRHGSAAAAARELATNQTTVSRRIARLETALGLHLFDFGARGAIPTPAALDLRPSAQAMQDTADALARQAGVLARGLSGTIRLTANTTVTPYLVPLIRAFQDRVPEARFDLDTSNRTLSLEEGEVDVAFRPGVTLQGDTLIARKLFTHPWGLYATDDYLSRHGTPANSTDLAGHRYAGYSDRTAEIEPIRTLQTRVTPAGGIVRPDEPAGMVGLLRMGDAIGLLPRGIGDLEPELTFCFTEPDLAVPFWIVAAPESHARPLVREFMRFTPGYIQTAMPNVRPEWSI
ncbi:LysR family transcriptional regulator [Jannaschia sp. S6380]|uniref:LysR family transcriptional regulator n=1 Tax=Jannaschia sp. S6380 TaxID=2926408 RepID=UPI001FF553C5|nr:LysR family transcriptional regulator [Jannaschia sp. S6380]MCK0168103.1 LysR family transcriptional regulator [Jannaschia sp. S6380]